MMWAEPELMASDRKQLGGATIFPSSPRRRQGQKDGRIEGRSDENRTGLKLGCKLLPGETRKVGLSPGEPLARLLRSGAPVSSSFFEHLCLSEHRRPQILCIPPKPGSGDWQQKVKFFIIIYLE